MIINLFCNVINTTVNLFPIYKRCAYRIMEAELNTMCVFIIKT